ncbi:MAG: hypothetical protein RQ750_13295, partial [Roseovarius sp.]|nr:hypothetical protein [Roseovarius sp.]
MVTQQEVYFKLLRKHRPRIANAFRDAILAARGAVDLAALATAIDANDLVEAARLLRIDARTLFPVTDAVRAAFVDGGMSAADIVPSAAVFGFNGQQDRALAFLARQGGDLVQGITEDTLPMLRSVVSDGIQRGRSSAAVARDITGRFEAGARVRVGGFLGL